MSLLASMVSEASGTTMSSTFHMRTHASANNVQGSLCYHHGSQQRPELLWTLLTDALRSHAKCTAHGRSTCYAYMYVLSGLLVPLQTA